MHLSKDHELFWKINRFLSFSVLKSFIRNENLLIILYRQSNRNEI